MKFFKIFSVIIFVYCCLGIFNTTQAEHNNTVGPDGPELYETPGMIKKPVPVYCGPTDFMLETAVKTFNQEPLVVGKVIVPQTGELVAMLTVFVNRDKKFDMSVLMTTLDTGQTCVLGYGKQIDFYKPKKEDDEVKPGVYNGVFKTYF